MFHLDPLGTVPLVIGGNNLTYDQSSTQKGKSTKIQGTPELKARLKVLSRLNKCYFIQGCVDGL